ncbi:hypothetical protein HYC85_027356, partial [Camellia sinensis]
LESIGDIEIAIKGSTPTTNVQDYKETKGHAQVQMSCVEGLVGAMDSSDQIEAEIIQSHSSNGLGKSSSHNVISTPWSGLFKSEIAKKKVVRNLKRYSMGYDNDQLQIPLEISKIGFKQWEHALVGGGGKGMRGLLYYYDETCHPYIWIHDTMGNFSRMVKQHTAGNGDFSDI